MKRTLGLILVAVLAAAAALAALDVYDSVTVKTLRTPLAATGTTTNTAVDVYDAKGICQLIVTHGPRTAGAATFSNVVTLQTSTASGGTYSTVTAITNATTGGTGTVATAKIDAASLKRYVRVVMANGTNTAANSVLLLYSK